MADRYWVGGTGTWSSTNTANWSTATGKSITASCATTTLTVTAGTVVVGDTVWSNNHTSLGTITTDLGGGNWTVSIGGTFASQAMSAATVGASVPTASDSVFFNANSNSGTTAFTVTMADTPRLCNDFTASGLDGTMTLAGTSIGLTVSGSLTFPATNFTRTYTGTTTFNATTTGKTITTNGVAFNGSVTLNGVGGGWTLGSALNIGSQTLTLSNGTFDTSTSNYAITASQLFSSNSNARTLTLNGSTITLSNSLEFNINTNLTLNAGTSTINFLAIFRAGIQSSPSGLTFYNVNCTNTFSGFPSAITSGATFNNFSVTTATVDGLVPVAFQANQTINGTLSINAGQANGNRRIFVNSGSIGTSYTLTCAAVSLSDVDFRDITIAGVAAPATGTRLGDCGGNSGITFTAAKTVYWSLVGGGNWIANGWAPGSGGTPATTNYPLPQDTVIIENTGLNTGATITINGAWNIGTLDTSTRTNIMTLASSTNTPTFYGNFTYGSGVTPTGTGIYTFSNRSTKTLNSGGKTFTQPVTINAPGGGAQLLTNNLTVDTARTTTLTQGTLDLNNLTLSTGLFSSSNSNTRTIAFGTGNITCTGTGTAWTTSLSTGLTTSGTQVVNVTSAGSTSVTVLPGTLSQANSISFNFTGGTYALTFLAASAHTVRNVNFTGYAGTWQATASVTIFGNLTLSTGMSLSASGSAMTFGATSGTQLITTNGKTLDFPISFDGVGGTFRLQDALTVGATRTTTLTNGSLDLNNLTLSTGLFSSSGSNTRTIAFGSTGSIVLTTTTAAQIVLLMSTATNFTFTGTSNISAAMSVTRSFDFGSLAGATTSNRLNLNLTSGASVPTFISFSSYRQIDFTGSTFNPGSQPILCHGFTLASGGTYTSTSFTTVGTGTLTYTGKSISTLNINTAGITTTLADAGQNGTTTLTNGTLNLAGFTLTSTTTAQTFAGTKNLTFNGGTLVCSAASATAWNNAQPTNFTTTAGTGTGTISMTGATAKTFVGGGSTYNCALNQGGAGTLTITGANTFNDITNTNATASQITFPASTTTTVNAFTLSGSSGNLVSLRSSTGGTRFTLSDASGTVSVSFLDIRDSNATGGATWEAFTSNGNVNSGNNLGWDFGSVIYNVNIAELINASDSILLRLTRSGSISETSAVSDTSSVRLTRRGSISETSTVSDSSDSQLTANGLIAETTAVSDSAASQLTANGLISETSTVSDSAVSQLTANGLISETSTVSDSAVSQLTANGLISETATVSDSAASQLTATGLISETAAVSDSAASQLTATGLIAETATVSDTTSSQLTANGAISESASVVDSATSQLTAVGLVSEQSTISDTSENILVRSGAVLEQTAVSDIPETILIRFGAVDEQAAQSDSASSQLTAVASISEQAAQSDSSVSQLTAVGLVNESASQSDSPDAKITMPLAVLEQGAISDAPENILIRFGDVAEQASLSDLASSQMTAVAAVSETATINDVAAGALTIPCTILEGSQSIPESTFTLPTGTSFTGSTYFNNTSASGGLTVVANGTGTGSGGGFAAGGNYVLFSGANTRSISTKALDLRLCNNFSFSIIRGTNTNGGELPDTGENIVVEYSINGGSSYTTIATILNTAAITTFTTLSYSMPVGAKTSSTIVRWRQVTSSAGAFDNYGIRTFTFDGQNALLVSDSPAARLVRIGAVSEQSAVADTPAARLIRQGLITESLAASETSAAILIRQGLLSEQATASETTAASLLRNGLISEQAAISDAAASQVLWSAAVSEQASISETISSLIIYFTSILEQGQASVALTTQMTMVASILEQARSADEAVSSFIVSGFINEALSAADEATIRFLWELIDDNQIPNWQNASTNQTPGWGNVNTATTPNWQNISNDQSSGWGTINTAADGNWNNINTSPE